MLKRVQTFVVVFMLLAASTAMAQGKIAVLSVQEAVFNTEVAKQRLKKLQKDEDYANSKQEFEKLKKKVTKQIEALQKDAAVMSEAKRASQQKKIAASRADLEHMAKQLQASEKDVLQELLVEMSPKVKEIVSDLIKSEKIGLILDRQVAMHADTEFSLTAKVTDRLNQSK
ncbi:MAG: OmpH family outer membrane protein [Pseudomonadales bacterium]